MDKIIVKFGDFKPISLALGDIIVKNYGSFKKSKPYTVTKIEDNIIVAKDKKDEIKFNVDSFGSFPQFLKLNEGINNTDNFRKENLKIVVDK